MITWTETPILEIWGQIRYLSSPTNVYNLLSGKIKSGRSKIWEGTKDLQYRAQEISSCIRKADEYYRASERVSLVVQPLLHYYGALSLVKAVILCENQNISLDNFHHHGLRLKPYRISGEKMKGEDEIEWNIENEVAISCKGVFPFLCEAVGSNQPNPKSEFSFKDLLRLVPDLSERIRRHYSEPSYCFYLGRDPQPLSSGRYEILFDNREDINTILRLIPDIRADFNEHIRDGMRGLLSKNTMSTLPKYITFEEGTIQGKYLIIPHNSGVYQSLPILFAGLFILSNVVRYKPLNWINAIDKRADFISIIEAFCSIAYRRLPNVVLYHIWNEYFVYATPSFEQRW